MQEVKKINLGKNINLTLIPATKFKSNLVSIYIQRILDKKEATKNALIPTLITRGCKKYPTLKDISDKLDDLYGSSMGADVSKRGERQVLSFKIISTNQKYIDDDIFSDTIEFFNEMINNPLIVDGGFKEDILEVEKQNLKTRIQAKINDKGRYALERCFEEMCSDEKYSISEYGYEDEIDKITGVELYNHYKEIIRTSPIDIVIEGDFDEDEVVKIISKCFTFERGDLIEIPRDEYLKEVKEVKKVEEKMDITQGKLVLGYRTNIDYMDEDKYYPLVVGCSVLGGGPHSKMFENIREKESLCYYIYSSVEKYKAILFISSGIEIKNYDKTLELINEQINSLKNLDITDEELENSKMAMINSMKSVNDNIGGLSDFYFAQSMAKTNSTIEKMIENISKVTKEEIAKVACEIELDTIYFLRN